MTNSINEITGAGFILAIGTNTTENHPVIGAKVKQALARGATLVVVDPRATELGRLAHYHLQIEAGTDIALLNGLAHVILAEGLWNKEFVEKRTEEFEAFRIATAGYTPERVAAITGVDAQLIREVARGYAKTGNATILYTMGITQHTCGTHNVMAVANLALLCGQIGRPSTGVNPLRGQNNVQGACDMGALPNVFSGYQPVADDAARARFEAAWGVPLPGSAGLTVGEMLAAAGTGIKALYIMGENPVLSDPDSNHVIEELEKLDFLVVQDIFLTETAALADVVLPAASFAEKDGTFSNTERRVQRVRKAVEPPGQARADWEIICAVAGAMGYPLSYATASAVFDEMRALTPSYAGIGYDRLEKGGLQWPCPNEEHPGTVYLHAGRFSRGLGRFHAVEHVPPNELPDADYPLVLSTGRRLEQYHTGTMSRRSLLELHYGREHLEISGDDARALRIADGEVVRVASRRGAIEIQARVSDMVAPGLVFTSFHFRESNANVLTNPAYDPVAKIPEYKVCAVRVEKIA
jgi:formate dehydrogenase alpha subunit